MKTFEVQMPSELAQELLDIAEQTSLEELEKYFLRGGGEQPKLLNREKWRSFVELFARAWWSRHHFVVRGIPVDNGATSLLSASCLHARFKPYRDTKIIKHFKMSPWTEALSQTTKEGHFHTDLNTAPTPPAVTVIHCRKSDPNPVMGESRVVLLSDLLDELETRDATKTLAFLSEITVAMVDEHKEGSWSGRIVEDGAIRFHPETLRAAARRLGSLPADLEHRLSEIYDSAMAVSRPFHLGAGDALFVSNKRALHYRGECTARFSKFPRQFHSREVYVLHLQDEPQWQS